MNSTSYTKIKGGNLLEGNIDVSGSKNASLQLIAASLLTRETCQLGNIPHLTDVLNMFSILKNLGAQVEQLDRHVWQVSALRVGERVSQEDGSKLRASICLLGALLARNGSAVVALPGGCNLGERPIDLHLRAFEKMGAEVNFSGDYVSLTAKDLHGADFSMMGPRGATVTGTANVVMAAVLAKGETIIRDAACDPEISDLCHFLEKMGASIDGIGTSTLRINGVTSLHGAEFTAQYDRIEAGTFFLMGLLCGKNLKINHINKYHLQGFLDYFGAYKKYFDFQDDFVVVNRCDSLMPANIVAAPHPLFPTDLQPQVTVLCTQAKGNSLVQDKIFPARFLYADELNKMGAGIVKRDGFVEIAGPKSLRGASVQITDLRAGAALVLAGLIAEGETFLDKVIHVDRGYENFEERLRSVGADITRVIA